jgi:uncharacterized protein (DUF2147 family)
MLFLLAVLTSSPITFVASVAHAGMLGLWATEGAESHVQIERCGEALCGKLAWLQEPNNERGEPKLDKFNSDDALKLRPILGLMIIRNFVADTDGNCCKGRIYNPEDGHTYRSNLTQVDDGILKVEGCFLIFCKGQIWTRVE